MSDGRARDGATAIEHAAVRHAPDIGSIAIIGLGLIGGSVARELAGRGVRIIGYDRDQRTLDAALAADAVHQVLDPETHDAIPADLVLLAVPVGVAPALLRDLAPGLRDARLIMDVGSTKWSIGEAAERLSLHRFVGAHPLTGDHHSGWDAARSGLFRGTRTFLCPSRITTNDALGLAWAFWHALGAKCLVVDAAEHDRELALTSHLPQVTASALASVLDRAGSGWNDLGPGGRDALRLAGSSAAVWTEIALDNAEPLTTALTALNSELNDLRMALERRDHIGVREFFQTAAAWHAAQAED